MIKYTATSTSINDANYCRMRFYLKRVKHEKPLRLAAYVKGSLLHELIKHFWERNGTPEEVKKKKKKYFDAETFVKYAKGKWGRVMIGSEKSKRKIDWSDDSEQYKIYNSIPKICRPLYQELLNEGSPLYHELPFCFDVDDIRFKGRIDEIRMRDSRPVIRDYKSGRIYVGEMKLNHDPQLTFYNAGLCARCFANINFAKTLGLEERCLSYMGNPIFIDPEIEEELFMIEDCSIHKTTRRNEHFFELVKMIRGIHQAIIDGDVYPERGRKCDSCDMKFSCEKELGKSNKQCLGQSYFSFAMPFYERPVIVSTEKQKRFNFKRKTTY